MRRSPLLLVTAACLLMFAASSRARAQTAAPSPATTATADEDFELNIDLRRISETDFHASTAVETDGAAGLRLRVGVALGASDIDVLLRNVRGRVRFRASLAPLRRMLDAHPSAAPPAREPRPPNSP